MSPGWVIAGCGPCQTYTRLTLNVSFGAEQPSQHGFSEPTPALAREVGELPPPCATLQPRLAVERGSGTDEEQEFGTAGSAWVTASPRRFCVQTVLPRRGSVLFRRRQCEAAGAWLGSLWPSAVVMCHEAVPRSCLASRAKFVKKPWNFGTVHFGHS